MKKYTNNDIKKYVNKPYSFIINQVNDESGKYFVARVLELDGLIGTGNTYDEAYKDVKAALPSYIETKLSNGFEIPEPMSAENYSGKFVLRLPKTLHKLLSERAKEEGVSLNQYALYKLAI